jgi:hypothetical protein
MRATKHGIYLKSQRNIDAALQDYTCVSFAKRGRISFVVVVMLIADRAATGLGAASSLLFQPEINDALMRTAKHGTYLKLQRETLQRHGKITCVSFAK